MNNFWHFPMNRPAHAHKIYGEINNDGCWICNSLAKTPEGYVKICVKKMDTYLHRVVYETFYGVKIAAGIQVRHLCGNSSCANPLHMTLGTAEDQAHDKEVHGTILRGEDHPLSKLTNDDVIWIRTHGILGTKNLAKKYNIAQTTIRKILNNESWKHLVSTNEILTQAVIIPLETQKPSASEQITHLDKSNFIAA